MKTKDNGRLVTRARQGRPQKAEIVYNESSRLDFITGFQQRKAERRVVALKKAAENEKAALRVTKHESVRAIKTQYQELVNYREASIACLTRRELTPEFDTSEASVDIVSTTPDVSMEPGTVLNEESGAVSDTSSKVAVTAVSSDFYKTPGEVVISMTSLESALNLADLYNTIDDVAKEKDVSVNGDSKVIIRAGYNNVDQQSMLSAKSNIAVASSKKRSPTITPLRKEKKKIHSQSRQKGQKGQKGSGSSGRGGQQKQRRK